VIPSTFAPLVAHIWQSTLFAALAALLALVLRHNQARIRYWLWLAASYKFLIPFSWLVGIGQRFEWRAAARSMPPAVSHFSDAVGSAVFLTSLPATKLAPGHASALPLLIWVAWGAGFAAVLVAWVRQWIRLRAFARAATSLPLGLSIPVVSTPARLEPGVFGIFRPVLLLPDGIAGRLTQDELHGVIAHELCHVRRRDNLTAAIHMLVEALFWFYPLVWWLGTRMIDERERACDEEVLRLGGAPEAYAAGILNVCKSYIESPVACVSGISGSDLKKRIARIMTHRLADKLSLGRKLVLVAIGLAAVAGPLGFGILNATQILGPSPTADWEAVAGGKRAFDTVSVKSSVRGNQTHTNVNLSDLDDGIPNGGLLSAVNFPLDAYIGFAYKLRPYQTQFVRSQLPKWAITDFDIEARAEGNPTTDQMRLMMQALLADRFKLAVHFETRQLPAFALSVENSGTTGPKLVPHSEDPPCSNAPLPRPVPGSELAPLTKAGGFSPACGALLLFALPHDMPSRVHVEARNLTMAQIANHMFVVGHLDREVLDNTRLNGNFDFSLEFVPGPNDARPRNFQPDPSGPAFLEALRQQLGLKLDPQTAPLDVLVVEHLEEPAVN
jgi:bla regulator protein blaR1